MHACSKTIAALLLSATTLHAQSNTQSNPKAFVQQAVTTELAADRDDHSRWLYHDENRKPENGTIAWVAETSQGDIKRILVREGNKLPDADQRAELDRYIRNHSAQSKQKQDNQHDDEQAEELLKLLPNAFLWTVTGTHGSSTILHFKPDPAFDPPDREARVFAAMEGDMAVDTEQHRIVSLKGKLIHDVDFGWGILGRLEQGGTFDVERRELAPGKWQITETHVHIDGHALLFKSIAQNEDELKTAWKSLPSTLTPEQAGMLLIQQPNN